MLLGTGTMVVCLKHSDRNRLKISVKPLASCMLRVDVACNSWLLVGVCTYGHCGDDVMDALIDEASD